jgi:hypothetical protein
LLFHYFVYNMENRRTYRPAHRIHCSAQKTQPGAVSR